MGRGQTQWNERPRAARLSARPARVQLRRSMKREGQRTNWGLSTRPRAAGRLFCVTTTKRWIRANDPTACGDANPTRLVRRRALDLQIQWSGSTGTRTSVNLSHQWFGHRDRMLLTSSSGLGKSPGFGPCCVGALKSERGGGFGRALRWKPGPQWKRPRDGRAAARYECANAPARNRWAARGSQRARRSAYEGLARNRHRSIGVYQAESKPGAAGNVIEGEWRVDGLSYLSCCHNDVRGNCAGSGHKLGRNLFSGSAVKTIVGVGQGY